MIPEKTILVHKPPQENAEVCGTEYGVQICTPAIKSLSGLWNEARKACILLIHGGVVQARFWASPLP